MAGRHLGQLVTRPALESHPPGVISPVGVGGGFLCERNSASPKGMNTQSPPTPCHLCPQGCHKEDRPVRVRRLRVYQPIIAVHRGVGVRPRASLSWTRVIDPLTVSLTTAYACQAGHGSEGGQGQTLAPRPQREASAGAAGSRTVPHTWARAGQLRAGGTCCCACVAADPRGPCRGGCHAVSKVHIFHGNRTRCTDLLRQESERVAS